MVILDTSIIIDHLRSSAKTTRLTKLAKKHHKEELAISVLSVQELYEGKSTRNKKKERALLSIISPLRILQYNYEIAKTAGKIARDSAHLMELADAAIAATCILNNASLATLNEKDFRGVKGIELVDV